MSAIKTKQISISSRFPAEPDAIWEHLQRIETLQYIAAPYAYFRAIGASASLVWCAGTVFHFKLRIFGILPIGVHTIAIRTFDKETYTVNSEESNRFVPIWKHIIILKPEGKGMTDYTDEVEIGAGPFTGVIALWSKCFYRHRQRRWQQLLERT